MRHGDLHIRGNMEVLDSRSTGRGGAVHVEGSVVQHRGSMIFNNCSTNASGGAVYVEGSYEQLSGSAVFLNCSAGDPDAAAGMSLAESKPFGGGGAQRAAKSTRVKCWPFEGFFVSCAALLQSRWCLTCILHHHGR